MRTSNPIESTFATVPPPCRHRAATVRLRTDETTGCPSRDTALAMVFKLAKSAERHWRKLDGANRLGQLSRASSFATASPLETPRKKPPPDPVHQD